MTTLRDHINLLIEAIEAEDYSHLYDGQEVDIFDVADLAPDGSPVHLLASASGQCMNCKTVGFIRHLDYSPISIGRDPICPKCESTRIEIIESPAQKS